MKLIQVHLLLAVALIAGCVQSPQEELADVAYINGRIHTVNESQPWAEAVAIKDDRFLVVGSDADVGEVTGEGTRIVDLEGRLVVPGLIDPHTHLFEDYRNRHFAFAVQDESSPESILTEVEAYAAAEAGDGWVLGGVWPNGLFAGDNPARELLDERVADRPVCLADQTAHSWWCNTRALEITGLMDPSVELPKGAIVERDEQGVPTGTVREHAIGLMRRSIPPVPHEEWVEVARRATAWANSLGLTSTHLAAGNEAHLEAARELEDAGDLTMRLVVALNHGYFDSPESLDEEREFIDRASEYASEFVDPGFVKIFMDGSPTARAAWLLEPYPGTDDYGTGYYEPDELVALYREFTAKGVGVMSHAIGDRSIREVLNAIEVAREEFPDSTVRHHVTHAAIIHPDDLPRFAELDVAIDLAPILPTPPFLRDMMEPILGAEGVNQYANPRAAIDSGAATAVGSDWQVSFLDPWRRIGYLVTRVDSANPEWGIQVPANALNVEEAIRAYTLGPAYALNEDRETGSIEPGKYADMIVLDRDLFTIDPMEIAGTKVLETLFAGRVVFAGE